MATQFDSDGRVRSAGGVVMRRTDADPAADPDPGAVEVLLVHRPAPRSDWTIPKGKADPGETDAEAALREVEEEAGWRCALREPVGSVDYIDRLRRPKVAHYWVMEPLDDLGFAPNDEIDDRRWMSVEDAIALATHDNDRAMLRKGHLLFTARSPDSWRPDNSPP
jgi:8-oxo-dGTP pyrophosphatase MutT (NUDIX family)